MDQNELSHYGVLGMKWGIRNYQNEDGTRISKKESKKQAKAKLATQDNEVRKRQYEQEEKAALAKGAKTRVTNSDIATLDKAGQVSDKFYDHTTKPLPKLPMKDIVNALENEYLELSKYGSPIPKGGAKKDMVLWAVNDMELSFTSKVNFTGGHSYDMEYYTLPDGTVKIGYTSMNG